MPVTYTIDVSRRVIRTRCFGNLTLAEVVDHFRELAEDPACPSQLDVLLDLSGTESLPESDQLMSVTLELGKIRQRVQFGLCAVIAERDALFGMMRIFEVKAEKYFRELQVFRVATEAEKWLAKPRLPVH